MVGAQVALTSSATSPVDGKGFCGIVKAILAYDPTTMVGSIPITENRPAWKDRAIFPADSQRIAAMSQVATSAFHQRDPSVERLRSAVRNSGNYRWKSGLASNFIDSGIFFGLKHS